MAGRPGDRVAASAPVSGALGPVPPVRGTLRPVLSEHRFTVLQYPKIYRAQAHPPSRLYRPTHIQLATTETLGGSRSAAREMSPASDLAGWRAHISTGARAYVMATGVGLRSDAGLRQRW